jgi:hypothetical protein
MKDLGVVKQILGMEIQDHKYGKLCISQHKDVMKILKKFDMNNVKLVNIPLAFHSKFSSSLCPSNEEENGHISCVSYASRKFYVCDEMVSISFTESQAGEIHRGRVVYGTFCVEAYMMCAIVTLLEDEFALLACVEELHYLKEELSVLLSSQLFSCVERRSCRETPGKSGDEITCHVRRNFLCIKQIEHLWVWK